MELFGKDQVRPVGWHGGRLRGFKILPPSLMYTLLPVCELGYELSAVAPAASCLPAAAPHHDGDGCLSPTTVSPR